jgi:GT2 family glycosyltransferase
VTPTRNPTVYVITVSHNRKASTQAFCESLKRQTYSDFVLILVDDASTDGTAVAVNEYPFRKEICNGDGKLWWAGGVRRGFARLKTLDPGPDDLVLIANDDTTFDRYFLEKAVGEIRTYARGVMLCVTVNFIDSRGETDGGTVCYWPRFTFRHYGAHPERIDCASTRCVLFAFSDLSIMGTFRPRLLPQYFSDYEFTIRARRRGIRLLPAQHITCSATEYTTGSHQLKDGSFSQVAAQMLTPRFSAHPRSLFMFILLSAPLFWKPICWFWALRTIAGFFLKATIADRLRGKAPNAQPAIKRSFAR